MQAPNPHPYPSPDWGRGLASTNLPQTDHPDDAAVLNGEEGIAQPPSARQGGGPAGAGAAGPPRRTVSHSTLGREAMLGEEN